MKLTRRRLLCIAASFAASPVAGQTARQSWQGRAFGAEVSITLHGSPAQTQSALDAAKRLISETEARFSLFDPGSELSRLNATGVLRPSSDMSALLQIAETAHHLSKGLFDPTVQPLWQALALGRDVETARAAIGWHRVSRHKAQIRLEKGQALTLNGIAQGYATDQIAALLTRHGFENALVNIGEHRGLGEPWRLEVSDPTYGPLARRTLTNSAIATSSPLATPLGEAGHILHHNRKPRWSTVSVEADSAALADALSTGLVLADLAEIRQVSQHESIKRITLIDFAGNLTTLQT